MDDDAAPLAQYDWEKAIKQTWDSVQEDESGNLVSTRLNSERDRSYRSKLNRVTASVRRGLIRYLCVAIDGSASAGEGSDYRPNRLVVMRENVKKFVTDYFDENPISQLSLLLMSNRVGTKITDLSANPRVHIERLKHVWTTEGKASLGNTIECAIKVLQNVPEYGHRELLIVFASLSSVDPDSIEKTVDKAIANSVRISIICLVAEVHVCKVICERTGGQCSVALDAMHFQELMHQHTSPAPELQSNKLAAAEFIYMGFPKKTIEAYPLFCFDGKKTAFQATTYVCPRCYTRAAEIPTQCCTCNLQLNSSTHIARSHHHLFPVPNFTEVMVADVPGSGSEGYKGQENEIDDTAVSETSSGVSSSSKRPKSIDTVGPCFCSACSFSLQAGSLAARCPLCSGVFCVDCDIYVHDSLHVCPSCG